MSDRIPAGGIAAAGGLSGAPGEPTVFFLTDYGLADEFVGVVHAVLRRLGPSIGVIDLTHGIAPFDVRGGAESLRRALPHLGPGVVLGVVDPGVGGDRRGVAVLSSAGRWFVGPDNGLLVPALEDDGGAVRAISLAKPADAPATFDGRDVFAPAAAVLALGGNPAALGSPLAPGTLVALAPPLVERSEEGGRRRLRAEVVWCDHFGNLQLAVAGGDGPPLVAAGDGPSDGAGRPAAPRTLAVGVRVGDREFAARRVGTFSALGEGELGLLVDSTGRLALAVCEGSAAAMTGGRSGSVVELVW